MTQAEIQEFLASGILEQYAEGKLGEVQEAEVDILLATYESIGEALEIIYSKMESDS